MPNDYRRLEHRPRKPKGPRRRAPSPPRPVVARRAVMADDAKAVARLARVSGDVSAATLAPMLASSGVKFRGRRYTEAPTAQDVADLIVAGGGKKLSARTMRKALGPRGPVVRKARHAAQVRRSREKLAKAKAEAWNVRFG